MKAILKIFALTAAVLLPGPLQAQDAVSTCFSKDLDASIIACGQALAQNPDDAVRRKVLLARAVRLAARGRHEDAIVDYDAFFAFEPANVMALNGRAASYLKLGRLADAKSDAARSLDADARNPLTYTLLSIIALNEGDLEGTIRYSTQAIDMDSRQLAAFGNRASALREQGKYPEALKDYNASLRIDAYSPRVLYQRGLTYFRMKDYDRALEDYRASQAINPDDPEVARGIETAERLRSAGTAVPMPGQPSSVPPPAVSAPPAVTSPARSAPDPEMVELCAQYGEEYEQRSKLGIIDGTFPQNPKAAAAPPASIPDCPRLVPFHNTIMGDPGVVRSAEFPQMLLDLFGKEPDLWTRTDTRKVVAAFGQCAIRGFDVNAFERRFQTGVRAKAIARFKRQMSVCPDWKKQQEIEAKRNFVNDLKSHLLGNPDCRRQEASIQEISRTLVGYPELDRQLEGAMMQLGIGQRAEYCRTVTTLMTPYLKLREIAGRCDPQLAMSLGMVFGSVMDEARQNGCR